MKVTLVVIAVLLSPFFMGNAVGQASSAPRITNVVGDEMIVKSSDTIVIECESTAQVEWTLPSLSHHFIHGPGSNLDINDRANYSSRNNPSAPDGYVYRSTLEVHDAFYLDTGYFICHHTGTDADHPAESAKVYVYVEDEDNLIVAREDDDDVVTVFAQQSKREVIPCKPTHPAINMTLEGLGASEENGSHEAREPKFWRYDPREGFVIEEAELAIHGDYHCIATNSSANKTSKLPIYLDVRLRELERVNVPVGTFSKNSGSSLEKGLDAAEYNETDRWTYDPHEGFIVQEASVHDHGAYVCHAVEPKNNTSESLYFFLNVSPATASAPKPHINNLNATYVVINDSFQLNCSAHFDLGTTVEMTWQVPAGTIDGQRITKGNLSAYNHLIGSTEKRVSHLELTVRNASKRDEGSYSCTATDHTGKSETVSTIVKVHEKNVSYVNISNEGINFDIERQANESVRWIVHFTAYPWPEVIWYKSGEALTNDMQSKFTVKKDQKMTLLEIRNVSAAESGVYELVIKTSTSQDSRNFTLRVRDRPSVRVRPEILTVKKDDHFNFRCAISSYPESEVEVFFRPCFPPQIECKEKWSLLFSSNSSRVFKASQNDETIWINTNVTMVNVTGRARVGGHYRCKACNSLGCTEESIKSRSKIAIEVNELDVDTSAIDLKRSHKRAPVAGEEFSVSCAVSLYRFNPTFTWTLPNGTRYSIDGKLSLTKDLRFSSHKTNYSYTEKLTWPRVSPSANGVYKCLASPKPSNQPVFSTVTLKVELGEPPQITNKSDEIVSISQFDELNLFCDATGTPLPTVEWFKDKRPITEIEHFQKEGKLSVDEKRGTTLQLKYVKSGDSGTYSCRFTNVNGTEQADFLVAVREQPLSAGIIAGIVIISIVVIVLLFVLIHKIRQDMKRKEFFHTHQLDMFDKGNPESINPDLPVDEQTELLPYDRKWEFPRDNLKLGKQLGAGAFGRVVKADAIGIADSEPITTVAVKMVRSQGNMLGLKALMSELKIMVHMGSHLNIVNLLGACTKNIAKGELLVIVEYCRFGNIQNYLIKHRSNFINEVNDRGLIVVSSEHLTGAESQLTVGTPRSPSNKQFDMTDYNGAHAVSTDVTLLSDGRDVTVQMQTDEAFDSAGKLSLASSPSKASANEAQAPWRSNYRGDYREEPEKPICTRELICWAFQIARGMEYLARRKILHGDLAARNVLLADNNIVKIADFGLAREVYRSGNYKKKGEGPLPVKWMAIESIMDRVFSTQSDVWSFGIVLWELFSLGKTPYPGMEADEYFFLKIKQGYRMEKPKYAPASIGEIMCDCWLDDPVARPSFSDLADKLGMLLEASVRSHYVELNEAYDRTNVGSDYLGMMAPVDYVNVGSRTPDTGRAQYVNIPQNDEPSRESEYLPMERMSPKVISEEKTDGQASYLHMTSPITTPQRTPKTNSSPGEQHFDFNFPPKLRKVDEVPVDSVELRPILRTSSDNQSPTEQTNPAKLVNGFSNPNYRNPPVIKCSDLDDPPSEHYTMPRVLSLNSDPTNYINVTDHSREPIEPYYAQPKSNAKTA